MKRIVIEELGPVGYQDIEIGYNEETGQFYFLKSLGADYYRRERKYEDLINGQEVSSYELRGYKQLDKSKILEEGKQYTRKELSKIYHEMNNAKVNFTFPKGKNNTTSSSEISESIQITEEDARVLNRIAPFIEITEQTEFSYEELEVMANPKTQKFYFLVMKDKDEYIRDSYGMARVYGYYDAISGSKILEEELCGYSPYKKEEILPEKRKYSVKEITELYNFLSQIKVNYTTGGNAGSTYQKRKYKQKLF